MIAAGIFAGAGIGMGLLLLAWGFVPRREPLTQALSALLDPPIASMSATARHERAGRHGRLATRLARALTEAGVDLGRHDANLRVMGRNAEAHLLEKAAAALAGLALPPAAVLVGRLGGAELPLTLAPVGALALGMTGFVLPDLLLRSQAAERRRAFRYALSSYLDLAHILLAAGAGVETALGHAADAGQGWPFAELRGSLRRSRLARTSPWAAFARLGEELDIPELREGAASLRLAGAHGAKIKASLEARAAALRSRDLTEMEADAEAATERMAVPSVLMVVGFVVFVGFPAIHEIMGF